jgi:hypothetical protein
MTAAMVEPAERTDAEASGCASRLRLREAARPAQDRAADSVA